MIVFEEAGVSRRDRKNVSGLSKVHEMCKPLSQDRTSTANGASGHGEQLRMENAG